MLKYARAQVLSAERRPPEPSGLQRLAGLFGRTAHKATFDYEPREGFIYVRSRMISSRCNDNFDEFPAAEIKKGYRTFIGRPVYVNHDNDDPSKARGVIIDATLHEDTTPQGLEDTWVEGLMEIDAVTYPKLANALLKGDIERTSMGVNIEYSICSFCGNKAETPFEYCRHVPAMKGSTATRITASGRPEDVLIRERCYGLNFFENSVLVEPPADPTAHFLDVDDRGLGGGAYTGGLAKAASRRTGSPSRRRTAGPDPKVCRHQPADFEQAAPYMWQAEEVLDEFDAGLLDLPFDDASRCPLCKAEAEQGGFTSGSLRPARHRTASYDHEHLYPASTVVYTQGGWGTVLIRDWEGGSASGVMVEKFWSNGEYVWEYVDAKGNPTGSLADARKVHIYPHQITGVAADNVHLASRRRTAADWTTIEDKQGWAAGELAMDDDGLGDYTELVVDGTRVFIDEHRQVFLKDRGLNDSDYVGDVSLTASGWEEGYNGSVHPTLADAVRALISGRLRHEPGRFFASRRTAIPGERLPIQHYSMPASTPVEDMFPLEPSYQTNAYYEIIVSSKSEAIQWVEDRAEDPHEAVAKARALLESGQYRTVSIDFWGPKERYVVNLKTGSRRRANSSPFARASSPFSIGDRVEVTGEGWTGTVQHIVWSDDPENYPHKIKVRMDSGGTKHWNETSLTRISRQAGRLDESRVPVEVNTLSGGDCPVCGDENYDGNECGTCGYNDPGVEEFTDPDLDAAKEFRQTGEAPVDDEDEAEFETTEDPNAEIPPEDEEEFVDGEEPPMDIDEALQQTAPEDEELLQEALDMLREVRTLIGPDELGVSLQDEVRDAIEEMRGLMEGTDPEAIDPEVDPEADPEEDSEEEPDFQTSDEDEEDSEEEEPPADEDDDEEDDEEDDNPFAKKKSSRRPRPRHYFR